MITSTPQARTARKARRCNTDRTKILPGDRYLRAVIFPGGINTSGQPWVHFECVPCAVSDDRGLDTGACLTYCHGVEPCALPFRHGGDHRCHRCPEDAPAGGPPVYECDSCGRTGVRGFKFIKAGVAQTSVGPVAYGSAAYCLGRVACARRAYRLTPAAVRAARRWSDECSA